MATIIVVDQYPYLQLLLKDELEDDGHRVLATQSGREALRLIDETPVDLVILEMDTSDLSGTIVLERIRRRSRYLPVIIYTAYPSFRQGIIEHSADACIVKSSDIGILKAAVRAAIGRVPRNDVTDCPTNGNCAVTV